MNQAIDMHRSLRQRFHAAVAGFDERKLFAVPDGFRNNIAWNIGHVVVTQQLLHYRLSGLDTHIDDRTIEQFRKGTSPRDWDQQPAMEPILEAMIDLPQRLADDFEQGRFQTYNEYKTSAGVVLRDIEAAIMFNNFHEGIHLGVILALTKLT